MNITGRGRAPCTYCPLWGNMEVMNAEAAKLNTESILEAFPVSVIPGIPRVLERVTFARLEGTGSGTVSAEAEAVRQFVLPLPSEQGAKQERAEVLARVNTWGSTIFFRSKVEEFILFRQQLRKVFRFWRSAPRPQVVKGWRVERYPLFNRLKYLPGLFQTVTSPELLKVLKASAETVNCSKQYLSTFSVQTINRIEPKTPRWRGTPNFQRARYELTPAKSFAFPYKKPPQVVKATPESVLSGNTPEQFARKHWEIARQIKN